jgi:hypothetical protein
MGKSESTPGEDAWIEKYRAAVNQTPVAKSRLEKFREAGKRVRVFAASCVGRIAAQISGRRHVVTPITKPGKRPELNSPQAVRRSSAGVQSTPQKPGKRKAG